MANNVYTNATVIKSSTNENTTQDYQLGTFSSPMESNQNPKMQEVATLTSTLPSSTNETILNEIKHLTSHISTLTSKINTIEENGMVGKDIDKQVVQAIKDLKHYASFFEQATFQMENKVLKTSLNIAQKIIGIEVSSHSSQIAKETINNLMNKIKTASKVTIHLNPKDYAVLHQELTLESFIELHEDSNVTLGGVVIASDLGNFDGSIESKVQTMLDSLDHMI